MTTARWALSLSIIALALVFVVCPETSTPPPAQDKVVIRVGSPFKPGSIMVDAAEKFKELVTQGSGGRIEVQIDAGTKSEEDINTLNSDRRARDAVQRNDVPAGLRPPVLLLHRSLRHEGLRTLHARLGRPDRPGGAGPVGEERT